VSTVWIAFVVAFFGGDNGRNWSWWDYVASQQSWHYIHTVDRSYGNIGIVAVGRTMCIVVVEPFVVGHTADTSFVVDLLDGSRCNHDYHLESECAVEDELDGQVVIGWIGIVGFVDKGTGSLCHVIEVLVLVQVVILILILSFDSS